MVSSTLCIVLYKYSHLRWGCLSLFCFSQALKTGRLVHYVRCSLGENSSRMFYRYLYQKYVGSIIACHAQIRVVPCRLWRFCATSESPGWSKTKLVLQKKCRLLRWYFLGIFGGGFPFSNRYLWWVWPVRLRRYVRLCIYNDASRFRGTGKMDLSSQNWWQSLKNLGFKIFKTTN